MLLERIFPKTGEDKKDIGLGRLWTDARRSSMSPFPIVCTGNPTFKQSAIILAGISTEGGKVLNPQDIIAVHNLNSYFESYKYVRLKFFNSDWSDNKLIFN